MAQVVASPYEGAATRAFNMRMLDPLHARYHRLVRRCADEGFDTSVTEIVHWLLEEGPLTPSEVQDGVRQWRRVRSGDIPARTE